jgi:hypothetical protein
MCAFHQSFHKGVSRDQLKNLLSDPRRYLIRVDDLAEPEPSTITIIHPMPVGVSTVEQPQRLTGLHENRPSQLE